MVRWNPKSFFGLQLLALGIAFVVALFPLWSNSSFPKTHDGENHLARIANYYLALREGQFPPRLAPSFMGGYGYPVFNYNYPLVNILGLPLMAVGLDVELSMKLILSGLVVLGAIGFYVSGSLISREKGGVIAALLFLTSPFLYSTLFVRGVVGELAFISLFPHLIFSGVLFVQTHSFKKKIFSLIYFWMISTSILLSHNLSVVMFAPFFVVFGLWMIWRLRSSVESLKLLIITVISAILSSMFFWVPVFFERNMVVIELVDLVNFYHLHFVSIGQLLFSPLTHGISYPGPVDGMGFSIGVALLSALLLSAVLIGKYLLLPRHVFRNQYAKISMVQVFGLFGMFCILIFGMTEYSRFIWDVFPVLHLFQFPWRLLLPLNIVGIFVAAQLVKNNNMLSLLIIAVLVSAFGILNTGDPEYVKNSREYYMSFAETSTVQHENKPVTFTIETGEIAARFPEVDEFVQVELFRWSGSSRAYRISSNQPHTVVEPTAYFPGWETRIQGKLVESRHLEHDGFIAFDVPAGEYVVETRFTQNTPARHAGNALSLIGVLILLVMILRSFGGFGSPLVVIGSFIGLFFILAQSIQLGSQFMIDFSPTYPYFFTKLLPNISFHLARWVGFDGVHYLTIAEQGYVRTGLVQAFFPAYPVLLSLLFQVFPLGDLWIVVTQLMQLGLLAIAGFGLFRLIKSHRVFLLILAFPVSFYFLSVYSEAFFLSLFVWYALMVKEKKYLVAGLIGIALSATKVYGVYIVLILTLYSIICELQNSKQQAFRVGVVMLIGTVGFIGYSLYLWRFFGNPLYFFSVQDEFNVGRQTELVTPLHVLYRYIKIFLTVKPGHSLYISFLEISTWLFAVISSLWMMLRNGILKKFDSEKLFEISLGFICLGIAILPSLTGTFQSVPRYVLTLFPIFIVLSSFLNSRVKLLSWISVSIILLVLHTALFLHGIWIS